MSTYNELTLLFVADRGNDQELEVKLDINQTCQIVYLSADIKHTKNQGFEDVKPFEDVRAILDSNKRAEHRAKKKSPMRHSSKVFKVCDPVLSDAELNR